MMRRDQHGFGVVAALVVVVLLAVLAAGMLYLINVQQVTSAQDVLSARALLAARAGNQWGMAQVRATGDCPAPNPQSFAVTLTTKFTVNVECTKESFNEGVTDNGGNKVLDLFTLTATACTADPCPNQTVAVASPGYIERTQVVIVQR